MPFTGDILKYKSLSIVGLEKNTGKTECLNYVLKRLEQSGKTIALTSIGVDGEGIDQVTLTQKPEIELFKNLIFITSEKHYHQRQLVSEILDVSDRHTALGRLVTARVIHAGKVMFSGPPDTAWLRQTIDGMKSYDVDTTIVDGALSRLSHGSPAVTESMILATGASVSANISTLVRKTKFAHTLIRIEVLESPVNEQLLGLGTGVYAIDDDWGIHDLEIPSVLLPGKHYDNLSGHGNKLFVTGAVGDNLLNFLKIQRNIAEFTLVVRDFTRFFVSPEVYYAFLQKGGTIRVLLRTTLLAVCVNPVSPLGFVLDSGLLCESLTESLGIPAYDIRKI
jgi:hypothetical protein